MSNIIGNWHAEQIKKYSFVKDSYIEKRRLIIVYEVDGEEHVKRLSVRANIDLLQEVIKKIRLEVGETNGDRGNYYII